MHYELTHQTNHPHAMVPDHRFEGIEVSELMLLTQGQASVNRHLANDRFTTFERPLPINANDSLGHAVTL